MKLLICTQAVDRNDPVLGFFVSWIEEFARRCERVEVICLRSGEYALPKNVAVHTLASQNKLGRAYELLKLSTELSYDRVFVHMNPEYLIVAGWYWRMRGIKTALWYVHKNVDVKLRMAEKLVDVICTASKASFRLASQKVHVLGHGIDTDFFKPDSKVEREDWWLSAGRLSKSKRHDKAIVMAHKAGKELKIAGDGPEGAELMRFAVSSGAQVEFLGGLTQMQLRDVYRKAGCFIHTSETGSLDKVVLEAVACGCPVKTNDKALQYLETATPAYVREHHSLKTLVPRILSLLA